LREQLPNQRETEARKDEKTYSREEEEREQTAGQEHTLRQPGEEAALWAWSRAEQREQRNAHESRPQEQPEVRINAVADAELKQRELISS
jgi:hypothetical protein